MAKTDGDKKSKAKTFKVTTASVLQKNPEFEDAEISASEDEGDDTRKHQKLLEAVQKLKGQKPTVIQRSEASKDVSEFNLTEVGRERVKLTELIKSLKQTTSHVSIKQQLKKVLKKKKLPIPLSKPQADKINRTVAYSKVSQEVSKWDSVVKANRSADQIIYPLKQPDFHLETTENFAKRFTTKTPLEEEVDKLLSGSEHTLDQEKEFTPAEEKALQAMSIEEAVMRHKELQKMRALLSYQEAKARRQKKIKSKKYHRILKKEKMKKLMSEFEEHRKTDPEAAKEELKQLDKLRILERATLKHKSTGKWAKYQKLRAKYNPESREALKEQRELGRVLSEKIVVPDKLNSSDKEKYIDALEAEERRNVCDDALLNLYFSENNANQSCKITAEAEDKVVDSNTVIEKIPNIVPEVFLQNNAEETTHSPEESTSLVDKVLDSKQTDENMDIFLKAGKKLSGREKKNCSSKTSKIPGKKSHAKNKGCDIDEVFGREPKILNSLTPDAVTCGDEGIDDPSEDVMTMDQAFGIADIISEFKEDKKRAQNQEKPQGINHFLPAWGTWAGPGIKPSKRKKRRFFIKPPVVSRRDDTLGNVIINEDKDKKAAAHQVSELPFQFSNVHQFQSIVRQPVGNTWNPEASFQNMIAPMVITKAGKIIEPIDADALVSQKDSDQNPSKLLKDEPRKLYTGIKRSKGKQNQKKKLKTKLKNTDKKYK